MFEGIKKVFVLVISLTVLICCASCAMKSKVDVNADTAPITSEWTFDHAVNKGNDVPRLMFDKDENLPQFSTDGNTFSFCIVSGKTYSGTIEANEDGTYTLSNNGKGQPLTVIIEGNSLTVYITDDTSVTFVTK